MSAQPNTLTADELLVYDLLGSIRRLGDYPPTFFGICDLARDLNIETSTYRLYTTLWHLCDRGIIACANSLPRTYDIAKVRVR